MKSEVRAAREKWAEWGKGIFRTSYRDLGHRGWLNILQVTSFSSEITGPYLKETSDSNCKFSCRRSIVELRFTVAFVPGKHPHIFLQENPVFLKYTYLHSRCLLMNTAGIGSRIESPVATTSPQQWVFRNTKSFQVKWQCLAHIWNPS